MLAAMLPIEPQFRFRCRLRAPMPSFPALSDAVRNGASRHRPVMLAEVLSGLSLRENDRVIDGTFGAGGYSAGILDAAPDIHVMAIDRDPNAIRDGAMLVDAAQGRLKLVEGRFGDLASLAAENGFMPADAIVLDIGVSSMQLDDAARGFSFRADGPLDMRMEQDGPSAADLVNTMDETALANLIYTYGEERRSRAVARAIVATRRETPFETTKQLADLVAKVVHMPRDAIHPATRTFQALRIAVNDELGELERALDASEDVLSEGGRLAVVTFHSLEDRIVKRFIAERAGETPDPSRHMPLSARPAPTFETLRRKPVESSAEEIALNPRARSARLRVARRTAAPARNALPNGRR